MHKNSNRLYTCWIATKRNKLDKDPLDFYLGKLKKKQFLVQLELIFLGFAVKKIRQMRVGGGVEDFDAIRDG